MATTAEIIVSVRAKVEQFKQAMADATSAIGANNAEVEKRAASAGNSFVIGFGKVMKQLGGFQWSKMLLGGLEEATATMGSGKGFGGAAKAFSESIQGALFNIPIAGQIAKITDNLLNGTARAAASAFQALENQFNDTFDAISKRVRDMHESTMDRETKLKRMREDRDAAIKGTEPELRARRALEDEFGAEEKQAAQALAQAQRALKDFEAAMPAQIQRIKEKYDIDEGAAKRALKATLSVGLTELLRSGIEKNAADEIKILEVELKGIQANVKAAQILQERVAAQKAEFAELSIGRQKAEEKAKADNEQKSAFAAAQAQSEDADEEEEESPTAMERVSQQLGESSGMQRGGDTDWNNVEAILATLTDIKRTQETISKTIRKYAGAT